MRRLALIAAVSVACVAGTPARAQSKASLYSQFRAQLKSSVCRKRLDTLAETPGLFNVAGFDDLLAKGESPNFVTALDTWSSDLLVKIVLELEQDFQVLCPEHRRLSAIIDHVKRAYLHQLGFAVGQLDGAHTNELFRGLLVLRDELPTLRARLADLIPKRPGPGEILGQLFGSSRRVRGVLVLGASAEQIENLETMVEAVCGKAAKCAFWDPNLLYKVVVQSRKGIALYVPEVAVLALSSEVLSQVNQLHQVVIMHELAHVAAHGAWVYQRRDWVAGFRDFSGWKRNPEGKWIVATRQPAGTRADTLTKLSERSSFSILPDVVYLGAEKIDEPGKHFDGFVFSKSYEESIRNNDPAEDLADHIAAYRFAPERFCLEGRNIAPGKYRWIAREVFQERPKVLNCRRNVAGKAEEKPAEKKPHEAPARDDVKKEPIPTSEDAKK